MNSEKTSDSDEGQPEFDKSSDEEVEVSADDNNSQGQQDENCIQTHTIRDIDIENCIQLGTSTNFLFGAKSRYGRAVRFHNLMLF